LGPIALWVVLVLGVGAGLLHSLGRGSLASLLTGGALMLGSLVLQRFTVSAALRPGGRRGVALLLLSLKLTLILVFIYVAFTTAVVGPLSFAAGVTALPVAIVLDVCYLQWSSREPRPRTP